MDPAQEVFALGDWQVDAQGNRLLRGAEVRPLRHKAMALLVLLARHPGATVTREQIVQAVWDGNHFVAPKAIHTAVWTIRQALGDDPEQPRYLATVAKKGYRLIAPVGPAASASASALAPDPDVAATAAPAFTSAVAAWPPAAAEAEPAPSAVPPPTPPASALPAAAAPSLPTIRAWHWAALGTALSLAALVAAPWRKLPPSAPPPTAAAPPALLAATPLTQYTGHEYLGRLSPDGRWLALAWWQGKGAGALYLRPAEALQAPPQRLSEPDDEVNALAWAPDGTALAYTALTPGGRCTLWLQPLTAGAPAGARRRLASCAPLLTPGLDWSPDGRWLAYSAEAEGAGGLFLIQPDGQGQRRLTTAPPAAWADHQPAWSPDSQRLAFARQDPADGTRDLYETGLDGRVRRLSEWHLQGLHGLSFLPGGQDLVYSTTQHDSRHLMRWQRATGQALPLGLEGSAPAVSADGRIVHALLRSHISIARLAQPGAAPQRQIHSVASDRMPDHHGTAGTVFVSRRSGTPELWRAPHGGAPPEALTQLQGQASLPVWAPQGDAVAFLGSCGPGRRVGLCLLSHPGGEPRPLAADAARYGRPAWDAQGRDVWVPSDRGGRWQLWRFARDGSPGDTLATEQPPGAAVAWAPDGQALVYQPRLHNGLRWRARAGGPERALAPLPAGHELLDWHWGPQGLLLLARGEQEVFFQLPLDGRPPVRLGAHALGSFPEQARFALAGDGSLLVEQADVAVADLMQAR